MIAVPRLDIFAEAKWWSSVPKGRAQRWGVTGDNFFRKAGRWSGVTRVFDKARDSYTEHIVDRETGAVLQHQEEKLSDHQGHGSAKCKAK